MNITEMQGLLDAKIEYDDVTKLTHLTVRFASWDADGETMGSTEVIRLTQTAVNEVCAGLQVILSLLQKEVF